VVSEHIDVTKWPRERMSWLSSGQVTGSDNEEFHREQVTDAYRAPVRLRLYAVWAGTIVPAAGLYAASYRTSLGAARLERPLDS
jgi:hypothetical protein